MGFAQACSLADIAKTIFSPRRYAIVISRLLHDARDLPRHVPDAHRRAGDRGRVPEDD